MNKAKDLFPENGTRTFKGERTATAVTRIGTARILVTRYLFTMAGASVCSTLIENLVPDLIDDESFALPGEKENML